MNPSTEEDHEDDLCQEYGCFWTAGIFGAFIITALVVGEWIGFPQIDGPFGGIFWMIAQGACLMICIAGSIRAAKDASVPLDQRIKMWILTLYPPTIIVILMRIAAATQP